MTVDSTFLEDVVCLEDAKSLLDQLRVQEADVDTKLEHLLFPDTQPDLTFLLTLQSSSQIDQQLPQLGECIDPAAETADGLSERVRKLDVEQGRVKECLKYVEDVQELKVLHRFVAELIHRAPS